jgi:hypothetical protein
MRLTEPYSLPDSLTPNNFIHTSTTKKNISFKNPHKMRTNSFYFTDNLPLHPRLHSAAVVDMGAAGLPGNVFETRSTITSSQNNYTINTSLDETTYVLLKAIVDNLIKNPKTFQGGKDDVKQWLKDF